MKKLVKIFDGWYNVDNIVDIIPKYNSDKIEIGCTIWYNCAMQMSVFHTDILFGKADGVPTHTTAEIVDHLNKGEDLNN